jgi:hypothetical protein
MSNDAGLNETVRARFQQWGLCKDEFVETGHFPPQLYVRSVLRVVGSQIFTQNTPAEQRLWGNQSIGCGCYNFDAHHAERQACHNRTECLGYGPAGAAAGAPFAWNEGDVEIAPGVYDIPLWAILPKPSDAVNLLVPGTPSASHIGMSTLRMEPQSMIIGHSAGVVAALAVEARSGGDAANVHTINRDSLHAQLLDEGQLMNQACQPAAAKSYGCKAQRCIPLAAKAAHSDPRCGGECGPLAAGEWLALKQFFTVDAAASPPSLLCHTSLNLDFTYLKKSEVTSEECAPIHRVVNANFNLRSCWPPATLPPTLQPLPTPFPPLLRCTAQTCRPT